MLARINGKPLILYTLDRLIPTTIPIIVAIPSNTSNDGLAWVLEENGYIVFRGFEDDVLDRFLTCAKKFKIDPIIRICGDSSMISDKEVVETLQRFNNSPKQWLTIGLGVQIFSRKALEWANRTCSRIDIREHVWLPMEGSINYPEDIKIVEDYINGKKD